MHLPTDLSKDDLYLKKTIKLLCTTRIRQPLSYEQIKVWLNQFNEGPELTLALLILRFLIYRTSDQLISSLKQALKHAAISHISQTHNPEDIDWRNILNGSDPNLNLKYYFGPLRLDYTKPGKSGELISRMVRHCININSSQLEYPSYFDSRPLNENERYLLVDDGVFTGDQMDEFITDYGDFMTSCSQTAIVVGLAHECAINVMKNKYPNIPLFYGEKITSKECFKSVSQEWIDDGIWSYKQITPLEQYMELIKSKFNDYHYSSDIALGYGNLGCMIAYEHGIPDNSLRLLWGKSDNWSPLIVR